MAFTDIVQLMYDGSVKLVYKNSTHRYYANKTPCPGVTTIIGKTIAKPSLMTWPLSMALKHLQPKLPFVTEDDLKEAEKAHITARDKGGNTGSIVHSYIEKDITGEEYSLDEEPEEVRLAMQAFKNWRTESGMEILATEQVVYSKQYHYAGTFDAIARDKDGKHYILDFKTTNPSREAPEGVYGEYFVQLGAYLLAYQEQGGEHQIDGIMAVSVKKTGKYHTISNEQIGLTLEDARSMWLGCLLLHNKLKDIKKALGGK